MHPLFPMVLGGALTLFVERYVVGSQKLRVFLGYLLVTVIIAIFVYVYRMIHMFPNIEPLTYWEKNLIAFFINLC